MILKGKLGSLYQQRCQMFLKRECHFCLDKRPNNAISKFLKGHFNAHPQKAKKMAIFCKFDNFFVPNFLLPTLNLHYSLMNSFKKLHNSSFTRRPRKFLNFGRQKSHLFHQNLVILAGFEAFLSCNQSVFCLLNYLTKYPKCGFIFVAIFRCFRQRGNVQALRAWLHLKLFFAL